MRAPLTLSLLLCSFAFFGCEADGAIAAPDGGGLSGADCAIAWTAPACAAGIPDERGSFPTTNLRTTTALVTAVAPGSGGSVVLTLDLDGAERSLSLPGQPDLDAGDRVAITEVDLGFELRTNSGDLLAFVSDNDNLVDPGAVLTLLGDATVDGSTEVTLADVPIRVVTDCVNIRPHSSPTFCPDVGMSHLAIDVGGQVVREGESATVTLGDGRRLAVRNDRLFIRVDGLVPSCTPCADFWEPAFDLRFAVLP